MSKKPPEWFEHYQKVSDKQADYLNKIMELRRSIQSKDSHYMMSTIVQERRLRGRRFTPRYPSMRKMERKVLLFGPQPFPRRAQLLNERNTSKFHLTPMIYPRNLPAIIKPKEGGQELNGKDIDLKNTLTVNKRNNRSGGNKRGNLSSLDMNIKGVDRKLLAVSKVMMSPMSSMEYITNVSSRKAILSCRQKSV